MIVASEIELRAGARLLLDGASFQVSAGDRIGLVGRNGAGKTTLAKVLAGEAQPAAGSVRRSGTVGYLPQDPRTGNLDMLAIDRVLSARGLDQLRAELRAAEAQMGGSDSVASADAISRYGRLGLPGQHLGQRGLARAIPADQADPVPGGHLERRTVKQQACASPQFDFACHDHDEAAPADGPEWTDLSPETCP